jgi:sugar diacid utilization regulator
MKLHQLLHALSADYPLVLPDFVPDWSCTGAALAGDPMAAPEDNVLVGAPDFEKPNTFYLVPGEGTPAANTALFSRNTDMLALYRRLRELLAPELMLRRQLAAMDRLCLSGTMEQLITLAGGYLENPVMVVDHAFKALALAPEKEIGIDSWDNTLRHGHPSRQDYEQASTHIQNFFQNEITCPQIIPYTEPDGRTVRRMVGCIQNPLSQAVHGGVEVIELNRPFTQADYALMERLCQLLLTFFRRAQLSQSWHSREERFLLAFLQGDPQQKANLSEILQEMPLLSSAKRYYLASFPLSKAQLLTVSELQALLAEEYPDSCSICMESCLLLLICGNAPDPMEEKLTDMLAETGKSLGTTVILSMPFTRLEELAENWNVNRLTQETAASLSCAPGCCKTSALFLQSILHFVTKNTDLHMFLLPPIRTLAEYDRTHDTQLFHTLQTYLMCESDLNRAAAALFIHRNTLTYRLRRIAEITRFDLEDLTTRQMMRISCLLWDFYYNAAAPEGQQKKLGV